ncbi:carbohydrate kinase family protein [Actinomadura harenae]|uniref:Carbohydrate kinase family protein n=1 Tax=Actinomadura harenae TaxID=2483351 RepID=A0A3M2M798_9ACTN|nr:carbohydrate kinase family protein [Actinomadura harenae]RMI45684.1 carbohydrate kinase family protein [Actinomadura harenae]
MTAPGAPVDASVLPSGPGRPAPLGPPDPCGERGPGVGTGGGDLDVFLTGRVFMDMIFTGLPGLPPPGTELVTDGLGSAPGGIANIAVAMSRLGLRTGLAAAFGDDMFGAYLWRTLAEQESVNLESSLRVPGWPTPVTVSLATDADRSMVTYTRPLDLPADSLVAEPPPARTCFVDIDRPVPAWALTARANGSLVFADLGWDPTETWSSHVLDRLDDVDVFLPNAVEAMAYTRASTPEAALDALAERVGTVVVKLGPKGAIAASGGERAAATALPVRALDPTGAGDVFAAGFVFATLKEWPLEQRLDFANLVAGLSVRHRSGSLGAPCWGEIAAFGESGEVPAADLERYAFVVPHIPEAEIGRGPDSVTRAEPTLR